MKFKYVKLTNYLNIYNGLGIYELYIDFTKCKNNIVLIRGLNGSGKSSLMQYLSIFLDGNDCFIPKLPAKKEICIIHNNIEYEITCIHEVKSNGDRDIGKVYITKCIGNDRVELNPNGNIRSYKDAIYSELNLDSNFQSLSALSCEDRGMVDKKPAERKRFINSILNNLEAYNNIYKTLNKRISSFKSMVNRLIVKIDSIGDEKSIESTITSIQNRLNTHMSEKDKLLAELSEYKSTIKLIDPDGSIQNTYNNIYDSIMAINNQISDNKTKIEKQINLLKLEPNMTSDDIAKSFNGIVKSIQDTTTDTQILDNKIKMLLSNREAEVIEIDKKKNRLVGMNINTDFNSMESSVNELKDKILYYEEILNKIGISKHVNLTKTEYIEGLNSLKEIKEHIEVLHSCTDYHILNATISEYLLQNKIPELELVNNDIIETSKVISVLEIDYVSIKTKVDLSEKAALRPTGCKFDDCFYIKDAMSALSENPKELLNNLEVQLENLRNKLNTLEISKIELSSIFECYNGVNRIIRHIQSKSNILIKLPNTSSILDIPIFLNRLHNRDEFEEIDVLYGYIEYCDVFEEYIAHKESLSIIEKEYLSYVNKKELIDELMIDIETLDNKLTAVTTEIEATRANINENNKKLEHLKGLELEYKILLDFMISNNNITNEKDILLSQFYNIKSNMERIKNCIDNIDRVENAIKVLEKDIPELIKDRDELTYNLKMLYEYRAELDMFSEKYEKIKTLKEYSSPSTGIQLLFIQIYMNDMISLANELLSLVFNGEYYINQFIINDKEFRIPCSGSGLPRDDISSLSTSQKSIISMILSFVLLKQSSTQYNIIKLDEIDGGLDEYNRRIFIDVLKRLIALLQVEQCLIVSHNDEINMDDTDVIILRSNPDQTFSGNIIYRYGVA